MNFVIKYVFLAILFIFESIDSKIDPKIVSKNINKDMIDDFRKCVSVFGHFPVPSEEIINLFFNQMSVIGGISSQREALMAIVQFSHESAGFTSTREWSCSRGEWISGICEKYDKEGCPEKNNYFGRGFIQLSHCYNYISAQEQLKRFGFHEDIVSDPDILARNMSYAMASAMNFWRVKVHEKIKDSGEFGVTTRAINGGLECSGGWNERAKTRWQRMNECLLKIGTNSIGMKIKENGCYN